MARYLEYLKWCIKMCDVVAALTIASTALGAYGQIQAGKAEAAASNYNAKVSEMNASISEKRAKDAILRGQEEEQQQRQKTAQIIGQQRAAMAANGVDLSFGSPLDTLVDTAYMGELDALTIRKNAAREDYDYRVQAANGTANANLSRMNAKSSLTGGYLGAAGTVLTGVSGAFKDYRQPRIGAFR